MEETFTKMIEVGWARPEGRFRRVFTDALMPGASPEQMTWVDELMRRSTSTENAVAFRRARMNVDVTDLLPQIAGADPGHALPRRPDQPARRAADGWLRRSPVPGW